MITILRVECISNCPIIKVCDKFVLQNFRPLIMKTMVKLGVLSYFAIIKSKKIRRTRSFLSFARMAFGFGVINK